MKSLARVIVLVLPMVVATAGGAKGFPKGYWERGFGFGGQSVRYNLSIKLPDIEKSLEPLRKVFDKYGFVMTQSGTGTYGEGQRFISVGASGPTAAAEKVAKALIEFGDLQRYSVDTANYDKEASELESRTAALKEELSANQGALEKMPIAAYLLSALQDRLAQARSQFESGKGKATFEVSLVQDVKAP